MQIVEEYTTENTVDIGDRMRTKINDPPIIATANFKELKKLNNI